MTGKDLPMGHIHVRYACVCDCRGLCVRSSLTCPATCDDNRINLIDCCYLMEMYGNEMYDNARSQCQFRGTL